MIQFVAGEGVLVAVIADAIVAARLALRRLDNARPQRLGLGWRLYEAANGVYARRLEPAWSEDE